MKIILSLLVVIFYLINDSLIYAQDKKQVAITIDDLPASYFGSPDTTIKKESFLRILKTLDEYNVKAMGFVTSKNIYPGSEKLLDEFVNRGHQIGNHTHSHFDLNNVICTDYMKDILECEKYISKYQTDNKYFRYALLHRGNTLEKRDSIYKFLDENKYIIVPVSIDNDEWKYNQLFIKALLEDDTLKAGRIGKDYINHMIDMTYHFDSLAYSIVNRNIEHILLLHLNYINSFYLGRLLEWYVNSGWEFISVDDALLDPIYSMKESYLGERGLSYIKRILYPPEPGINTTR